MLFILFNVINIAVMAGYFALLPTKELIRNEETNEFELVTVEEGPIDENVLTVIYSVLCVVVAGGFQIFVMYMTKKENL